MKRKYYTIECERCVQDFTVVIENSDDEPMFCPLCGEEAYDTLEDEEEI